MTLGIILVPPKDAELYFSTISISFLYAMYEPLLVHGVEYAAIQSHPASFTQIVILDYTTQ